MNGLVARDARAAVEAGDHVTLTGHSSPAHQAGRVPFPASLRLIHEDEDLLVIDKPPGLLTVATDRERERTAYRFIWDYLASRRPPGRPFIVHRLDRDTSGLVAFAKSPAAKRQLQAQFEARTAEREYVAVVEGRVQAEAGTLESRLVRTARCACARAVGESRHHALPGPRSAPRHDRARADARHRPPAPDPFQLADLATVAGDREHGSRHNPFGRLALHACRLGLVHPATGQRVSFESAPPDGWV